MATPTLVFELSGAPNDIGLKEFIGERTYRDLTDGGQDKEGQQALLEATNLLNSRYLCAGKDIDWDDQRVVNAGLCYASWFLYAKAEIEIVAKDKRLMGNQMLYPILGTCAFDINQGDGIDIDTLVSIKVEKEQVPPPHSF